MARERGYDWVIAGSGHGVMDGNLGIDQRIGW